jgi:hypothetical protein
MSFSTLTISTVDNGFSNNQRNGMSMIMVNLEWEGYSDLVLNTPLTYEIFTSFNIHIVVSELWHSPVGGYQGFGGTCSFIFYTSSIPYSADVGGMFLRKLYSITTQTLQHIFLQLALWVNKIGKKTIADLGRYWSQTLPECNKVSLSFVCTLVHM